jgi:CubicO group peptidase (beta-lactamase class C family)
MRYRRTFWSLIPVLCLVLASSCRSTRTPIPGTTPPGPSAPGIAWNVDKLAALDDAVMAAVSSNRTPGAVVWLERHGYVHHGSFGNRAVDPVVEPMTVDTLFDAASLTKVLATTPAILKLVEEGRVDPERPVSAYIPEFVGGGREAITVGRLLTHTSGLPPGLSRADGWSGYEVAIQRACREPLAEPPGTRFRYSDINFILLGEVVHRVSGVLLDQYCAREIYGPLGMRDTRFLPVAPGSTTAAAGVDLRRIAPTEKLPTGVLRGVVHDPTSRRMGGVAGHAGLFITAADLARFCRMMLNEGTLDGHRVFRPETVRAMVSVHSPPGLPRRGWGWDIDSPYAGPRGNRFPIGSYGHSGWTGTSVWIDPFSQTFVILLANRNHPTEDGNVIPLRRQVGTLAAEAVAGFDFDHVPGALPPEPKAH